MSFNNITEGKTIDLALGGTLIVTDLLIIVFNVLTIMVITRFPNKNAVDVFVVTLAGHDLVKGIVPVPISIYVYFSSTWSLRAGTVLCNLYGWIAFMTNSGSMLILTLMALERYCAIVHPYHYRRWVSIGKVQMISFLAVVFTGFHSALPLMGVGRMQTYYHQAYSHFDMGRSIGHHYSAFVLCYGLMMVFIVIVAYTLVFHKIRALIRRHKELHQTYSESYNHTGRGLELDMKMETMFSYLALVLMILFLISWLPFLIVLMASQLGVNKDLMENLHLFAIRVAVINSMLNPLAYVALCKSYRFGILYYFRKLFSFCGAQYSPSYDVWNPTTRGTLARQQKSEHNKDSSCDSGFTEYKGQRIPSHFQSYDTYRAKKEEKKYKDEQSLLQNGDKQSSADPDLVTDTLTMNEVFDEHTEAQKLLQKTENDWSGDSSKRRSSSRACNDCSSIDGTPTPNDSTEETNDNKENTTSKRSSLTHPQYQQSYSEIKTSTPSLVHPLCSGTGQNKARRFTQPHKSPTKTDIKMKRRRSKSMTNLLEAGWTPYRLFAKKSASTVEFIFQNSLQCNEIHTLDNLICRDDGCQINNSRDGANTPLRNLAKMIREFDSTSEEHIRHMDDYVESSCCSRSHCHCHHSSHHHHHHYRKVVDHHFCCCCRKRCGVDFPAENCIPKNNDHAKSVEELSHSCHHGETETDIDETDPSEKGSCTLKLPDIQVPQPGSRRSRDFLEIDKLLEQTVLSLYTHET